MEVIGRERRRTAKKSWVTEDILRKVDERKKWKNCNTKEGKRMYKRLEKDLGRETELAREKFWTNKSNEIENLDKEGKLGELHRPVKELTWNTNDSHKANSILSKQGCFSLNERR